MLLVFSLHLRDAGPVRGSDGADALKLDLPLFRGSIAGGPALALRHCLSALLARLLRGRDHREGLKRGLWAGTFDPPSDWRRAKRAGGVETRPEMEKPPAATPAPVPATCAIKGNISRRGDKIYHLPGTPMRREKYIHHDFDAPPSPKPPVPMSSLFPLRRPMTPDESHELWADTLEALAYLQRVVWEELRQNKPLAGIADFIPNLSGKPIADMSAGELATLVTRLRVEADRLRARAPTS